jgi:hypothetical protein
MSAPRQEPRGQSLQGLGQHVDRVNRQLLDDPRRLQQIRRAVLEQQGRRARRGLARPSLVIAGAVAAMALLISLWTWLAADGNHRAVDGAVLRFAVQRGDRVHPGQPGRWIAAGQDRPTIVRFAGGSSIALRRGPARNRTRVTRVRRSAIAVALDGAARFEIVKGRATTWRISAGPFRVHVKGTAFDLGWDEARATFELVMHRGRVEVRGPGISGVRALSAGQRLRRVVAPATTGAEPRAAEAQGATVDPAPDPGRAAGEHGVSRRRRGVAHRARMSRPRRVPPARSRPTRARPGPLSVSPVSPASPASPASVAPPAPPPAPAPSSGVFRLARAGRYCAAIQTARRLGWPELLDRISASQLLVVGDAARLCADAPAAIAVYQRLRQRFPASAAAATAAFGLGQIAFDLQGAHREAARWFSAYLAEAETGPLAREALGRLLEALVRSSQHAAACRVGQRYLARYPRGPHARRARRACDRARAAGPGQREEKR